VYKLIKTETNNPLVDIKMLVVSKQLVLNVILIK